jgi:proline iminopeptidase
MYAALNDTDLYVDVDGGQLRLGPDRLTEAPVVIVLHGGPGLDQGYLRPDLGRLADIAQLVFVDLRGHGRSAKAPVVSCTLEQLADDVVALCRHLGLERPILLGHSAGGFVALHAALRGSEQFGGLVLCNTAAALTAAPEPGSPSLVERAGPEAAEIAGRVFSGDVSPETGMAFQRLVVPYYAAPAHMDVPGPLFRLSPPWVDMMRWFFAPGGPAAQYDVRDRLDTISVPTLVVSGAYDWVCPPGASRAIAAGIPGSVLEILPNAGHFSFAEEPERFHRIVEDFLRQLP